MTWLNPLAWFGLAAVAVPVVVHLLAHRRADRVPFPTLRFIQPTRLASIQRRALEDVALLAVRAAIVVAAVAALAGPLFMTPARRAAWDARLVTETADSTPLADGIHRAVARLESAPPGRRELVIAGPLTIGALGAADLEAVPAYVGIRFTRTGTLPASREIAAPPLVAPAGEIQRTVLLAGADTRVREEARAAPGGWPVEVVASPALKRTADAALAAVLALRVPVPPADRRAQLVLLDADDQDSTWRPAFLARRSRSAAEAAAGPTAAEPTAIRTPWMADAAARIARDPALGEESNRVSSGLSDARFGRDPWLVIARARDGRPVAAAAASREQLLVTSVAADGDLIVPTLLRAVAISLAPAADLRGAEVVPIPDRQLRAWTRQPGPPSPRPETVERDDRRWLWGAVLVLLAIETLMRRSSADADRAIEETRARVA